MAIPIFSVEGLVAWLEQQPPETIYDYTDIHDCLICRYFQARGLAVRNMGPFSWTEKNGTRHPLDAALNIIAVEGPGTYGDALIRAKAMLGKQETPDAV